MKTLRVALSLLKHDGDSCVEGAALYGLFLLQGALLLNELLTDIFENENE